MANASQKSKNDLNNKRNKQSKDIKQITGRTSISGHWSKDGQAMDD
jgi:hypothetical protein